MSWIDTILGLTTFRTRRRIGDFAQYLIVEEIGEDELEISEHPVQVGAQITDHAYKKMATVSIQAQFSQADTLVPLDETYRAMLELQESRIPFQVITGKRIYNNMLFKSLRVTTDRQTENVLAIAAILREVRLVEVVTVSVPPRDKQKNPGSTGATEKAGTKKPQEVKPQDQPTKKSALYKIAGIFG